MARPGSDLPQRLIRAARRRFLAQGVDGASLRAIAQDAETSVGMVYYHFRTKDELFLAVVDDVYEGLLADMRSALDPVLPVRQRVQRFFERFGRLSDDEAATVSLIVREALVSTQRLTQVAQRFQRGHLPLLLQLFADGVEEGVFAADLPPIAMLSSMVTLSIFTQLIRRRIPSDLFPFALATPSELAGALGGIFLGGVGGAEGTD